MNFTKTLTVLAAAGVASAAMAVDVTNVQMTQNPNTCKVTITYELSGPAVVTHINPDRNLLYFGRRLFSHR